MDKDQIRDALTALLQDIADKAQKDARSGESDIGSIFRRDSKPLQQLDMKAIDEAIANIDKATATKEGARRLMSGVMLAAKVAAKIACS